MNAGGEPLRLRDATLQDLPALLLLEAGFPGDRLSRRQFRHHLQNANARLRLVEDEAGRVLGYALLLRRAGSAAARLYSLVVDPDARGRGIAGVLLRDAEGVASSAGLGALRLEVRVDNAAALALYRRHGFHDLGVRHGYYEDEGDALCLWKALDVTGAT
jgi:[ribosomal protein S18]-alanine N-acetyltransferase